MGIGEEITTDSITETIKVITVINKVRSIVD